MAEKVNEEAILVYSSPAFPPKEIDMNSIYYYGKDQKGYYLLCNGKKKYEKIEYIKTFFIPKDGEWE